MEDTREFFIDADGRLRFNYAFGPGDRDRYIDDDDDDDDDVDEEWPGMPTRFGQHAKRLLWDEMARYNARATLAPGSAIVIERDNSGRETAWLASRDAAADKLRDWTGRAFGDGTADEDDALVAATVEVGFLPVVRPGQRLRSFRATSMPGSWLQVITLRGDGRV